MIAILYITDILQADQLPYVSNIGFAVSLVYVFVLFCLFVCLFVVVFRLYAYDINHIYELRIKNRSVVEYNKE